MKLSTSACMDKSIFFPCHFQIQSQRNEVLIFLAHDNFLPNKEVVIACMSHFLTRQLSLDGKVFITGTNSLHLLTLAHSLFITMYVKWNGSLPLCLQSWMDGVHTGWCFHPKKTNSWKTVPTVNIQKEIDAVVFFLHPNPNLCVLQPRESELVLVMSTFPSKESCLGI